MNTKKREANISSLIQKKYITASQFIAFILFWRLKSFVSVLFYSALSFPLLFGIDFPSMIVLWTIKSVTMYKISIKSADAFFIYTSGKMTNKNRERFNILFIFLHFAQTVSAAMIQIKDSCSHLILYLISVNLLDSCHLWSRK